MKHIRTQDVTVTTAGTAASAVGAASSTPMSGELLDIYCDWSASAPNTTDLVISESTFGTILSKANAVTDIRYAPRMPVHTAAAGAISGGWDRYPLSNSVITFTLAGSDALAAALVATIRWVTDY